MTTKTSKQRSSTIDNTQLTNPENYDAEKRMKFSDPIKGTVPDSKPLIEYKRINISTINEDGTEGCLILPTERVFSFGVTENKSVDTGNINGYTLPLCLWNRDGPSDAEKTLTDTIDKIVNVCINYLIDNKEREDIDLFELTETDLLKEKGGLNPLYWKREKYKDEKTGKTIQRKVPGRGPTLYAKLIFSKKNNKFLSEFVDVDGNTINPLDLMGKYLHTIASVKFESLFIGGNGKISLQIKLYEASCIEISNTGMKRLLTRPQANSIVTSKNDVNDDETTSNHGSLHESDDGVEIQKKPPVKRVIRKVVPKAELKK